MHLCTSRTFALCEQEGLRRVVEIFIDRRRDAIAPPWRTGAGLAIFQVKPSEDKMTMQMTISGGVNIRYVRVLGHGLMCIGCAVAGLKH